ncbi:glycosyltransferase family 10 [Pedobacter sp. PF22-3]|uniref:glycosyltransferase family 10 domain-containing protein n=1 Tax=Pedobacter sp. PF22-3 TaxID=2994467 RepID=UPI0022481B5E|nr:glycosyltransferase family 10 [Pedobacter sp. PF22-3]MCX2492581.1 glycosyltransferase family 10 [Pedobacter sp. PF22-3]
MKPKVKIKVQNGLSFEVFKKEVLDVNLVSEDFDFIESATPDFIIFGPYGNDIPPIGNYVRIGYFCENITPDFEICDWAFGIPLEEEFNNPKYKRIQWHGISPNQLIKETYRDLESLLHQKNHFCNFVYSNPVPFREEFFRQLSKYKKIDSPGMSMNNMAWPQNNNKALKWNVKRDFLKKYKFTISFENYVYPGYQTEKLYDPMFSDSLPIYCGNPLVNRIFNNDSFLNTADYLLPKQNQVINWLEKNSQSNFVDIRPQFFKNPYRRVFRKVKSIGRSLKMKLQFNNLDFSPLIDRIIELDKNDDLYLQYHAQQWLSKEAFDEIKLTRERWYTIFSTLNE